MKQSNSYPAEPALVAENASHTPDAAFTLIELVVVVAVIALLALVLTPALARSRVTDHSFQCQNNLRQLINGWRMYAADNGDKLANAFNWVGSWLDYSGANANTNVLLLKQSLLWPNVNNLAAFKCPADMSRSFGRRGDPRVRSYSISQAFSSSPTDNGHWTSPPWRIYMKTSDIISPQPANTWVFVDENPDSINDGAFAVAMDPAVNGVPLFQATTWQDTPANYHCGGCGFSFADGHSELHKWRDPRTLAIPTTYNQNASTRFQGFNKDITWVQQRTTAAY